MRWFAFISLLGVSLLTAPPGVAHERCNRQKCGPIHVQRSVVLSPHANFFGWGQSRDHGWVFHGPGYIFVPGKGILDAPCDLPTSACPNSAREGG
jgi:hypothetical protein